MNTFEVSILIADLTILITGAVVINLLNKRIKRIEKKLSSMSNQIFEIESDQRYERKFELSELKNKLELLEVKVSKSSFDFEEFRFHFLTKKQSEKLSKNVLKTMDESKSSSIKKETKPSESVKNEVVDLIKKESDNESESTPRMYKKSNITPYDIENAFREKYKMTYYGYREKYGEEALKGKR